MALSEATAILARFGLPPATLQVHGGGIINASYRVVVPSSGESYLLQRLNPAVFPDGGAVARNVARVTRHLELAVRARGLTEPARRFAALVSAPDGEPAVQAKDGAWWRLLRFIEDACAADRVTTVEQAEQVGRGYGIFHALMRDYAGPPLEETIPGFHDTPARVRRLEAAASRDLVGRVAAVHRRELDFALERREYATLLTIPLASGAIPPRLAHNDAKAGNALLDARTGRALAVVDLDTVMPGTPLFDAGDLIRSVTCSTPEDHPLPEEVEARPAFFAALARGFLAPGEDGDGPLTSEERARFVTAGLVLTYEQGIRFLTDHLEGDRYYRTSRAGQNLDRARVQFRLLASLEGARDALVATVAAIGT